MARNNNNRNRKPNNNRSGNNSKPQRDCREQSRDRDAETSRNSVASGKDIRYNDPKWYEPYPGANKDVASLAFSNIMGLDEHVQVTGLKGETTVVTPGVMTIQTVPTIGGSNDYRDAINTCAMRIYSYVRHANSGHSNYDPTDLMLYCMAVSNAYAWVTHAFRLYGIANTYSMKNRYLPRSLVEGCGVNFDELIANLPAYRAKLNNLVYKLAPFAVPKMTYFDRLMGEYSNWFTDEADVSKAQAYILTPGVYYFYDLDATNKGSLKAGELVALDATTKTLMGINDFLDIIETQVDHLAASEDCGIMSGDILKAFGDGGIYHMNVLTEDYNLAPVCDTEYLYQIKNATIFNEMDTAEKLDKMFQAGDNSWGIYQTNDGILVQQPKFVAYSDTIGDDGCGLTRPLLNGVGDYDPDRVMEETRFMVVPTIEKDESTSSSVFYFRTMPASIIKSVSVGVLKKETSGRDVVLRTQWTRIYGMYYDLAGKAWQNQNAFVNAVNLLAAFRYAPVIRMCSRDESEEGLVAIYSTARLANYTFVDQDVLDRMHRNALYGLFTAPDITGSFGKLEK